MVFPPCPAAMMTMKYDDSATAMAPTIDSHLSTPKLRIRMKKHTK